MIFSKEIEPACDICQHGKTLFGGVNVKCSKKGLVSGTYKCRHYKYDPFKRIPQAKPPLAKFSPEDFTLD